MVKKSGAPTTIRLKAEAFAENITKRGAAAAEKKRAAEEADKPKVSPWVVYLFIFVIVGSAVLQVISTATGKSLV